MRRTILLAIPFLGGCLAPAWNEDPTITIPPSVAQPTQNDKIGEKDSALTPKKKALSGLRGFKGEESVLFSDESFDELPDPETLVDNLLLSGVGEDPPEDEGVTVPTEISFDFPVVENEKVHYYIDYFTGRARNTFALWLARSGRYLPLMQSIFEEEGLPLDLTYLALIESGFNVRAYSWAHAMGPWQFIESTGRSYGLQNDWWRDERRDFYKSTRAAARFLRDLNERFDGNWYLALASYNCGPGRVSRAISSSGSNCYWELSRQRLIPPETRNYVPKLLAALLIAKEPQKYGFDITYQEPLAYEYVTIPTTTDLEIIARLAGATLDEIKNLNPELRRWSTPPGIRDYRLRIPAGVKSEFEARYAGLSENERAKFMRYTVRKGDTLGGIAQRYNTRVEEIASLNNISNPRALRIGAELVLPLHPEMAKATARDRQIQAARTRTVTYKVRSGDSLWSISRQFGVSEKNIRDWNKLGNSSLIRQGQELRISIPTSSTTAQASGPAMKETAYEVRSGDSLWSIGTRFGVTVEQLRTWNNLSTGHVLRPGQRLTIIAPVTERKIVYQVKPGDTLWGIGIRHNVEAQKIMEWNNLGEGDILRPGDRLTLMVPEGHRG
jgi:membrane-bound lytic murein transglycosylase D